MLNKYNVAAYARVSTDSTEQRKSFESQVKYYKEKINMNPNWIFTKVYADEGITGTSTKNRQGFNLMLMDAKLKKFDILLVKSISRLARNTIDALQTIRTFKDNGIRVISEEEHLDTGSQESEFLLTLIASLAQQESEKMSERVKVGLKHKAEMNGIIGGQKVYGYFNNGKTLEIDEEEAEVVRFIFNRYLEGYGSTIITRELNQRNIPGPLGGKWHQPTVLAISKNEKYIGNLVQCKTSVDNIFTKRRKKNENPVISKGVLPKIIDEETFNKVQAIHKSRTFSLPPCSTIGEPIKINTFTRKLKCSCCGRFYSIRINNKGKTGEKLKWKCINQLKNSKLSCPDSKEIEEDMIKQAFEKVIELIKGDYSSTLNEFVEMANESLSSDNINKRKNKIENDILLINKQKNKLIDLYSREIITVEELDEKVKALETRIYNLNNELDNLVKSKSNLEDTKTAIIEFKKQIENKFKDGYKFDNDLFRALVNYVEVGEYLKDGEFSPFNLKFKLNLPNYSNNETPIITFSIKYINQYFKLNENGSREKMIEDKVKVSVI